MKGLKGFQSPQSQQQKSRKIINIPNESQDYHGQVNLITSLSYFLFEGSNEQTMKGQQTAVSANKR